MSTDEIFPTEPANREAKYTEFERELTTLINQHSMENGSNTPDYILASYMVWCLRHYERTVNAVKKWHTNGWK